jgi:hypothetical protein
MTGYRYEFDNTTVGDAHYKRPEYEAVQEALKLLEAKLSSWNRVAMENGALEPPYEQEVNDLKNIIEWGEERLSNQSTGMVHLLGISVGNTRYLKAALIHAAWFHEKEINQTTKDTWPSAVIDRIRSRVRKFHQFAEEITQPPAGILEELRPEYGMTTLRSDSDTSWDAFVSHASEDKEPFVRALADALRTRNLRIWYDDFTLTVGDSLRRSIDRGLAHSRFGVVVLSPTFFGKEWPQKELDGLVAREVDGRKVILPVWHGIGAEGIRRFSPMLADRVAISSDAGVAAVVDALIAAMR